MLEKTTPYDCHIFVCTNDRQGRRKSCADHDSLTIGKLLKDAVNDRGLKGRVRVSKSGCLGLCADGPNVIVYPQKIWFSNVQKEDISEILRKAEPFLKQGE